jgi:hypothetical protein
MYNGLVQLTMSYSMGISEVRSPVTRRGSKVASEQPMSPGTKSAPGREDATAAYSVPPQPQHRAATHQEPPIPSSTPVTVGPEE